jgi:hypothetical protein
MKKPSLRVTKWLGDIPVEGECTACPDVTFKVKPITHRPTREEYGKNLQQEFDRHFKHVHKRQDAGSPAPGDREETTKQGESA